MLNYRKSKRRTVQIVDELPNQIFDRLVREKREFRFAPLAAESVDSSRVDETRSRSLEPTRAITLPDQPTDQDAVEKKHADDRLQTNLDGEKLESVLKFMNQEAKRAIEETGINYLHLALGFLSWRERDDSNNEMLAPLILIPVRLERIYDARLGHYTCKAKWSEEDITHNLCLINRLENDFGMRMPEYDGEEAPESYLTSIAKVTRLRKGWEVRREALLGFFSFHKLTMYADLDPDNWTDTGVLEDSSLVGQIVCGREAACSQLYADSHKAECCELSASVTRDYASKHRN